MNELSTRLTKINFKWLIDHCTDKENWGKKWTIYDYDGFKCVMNLETINMSDNNLTLRFTGNGWWNNGTINIPMSEEHFNESIFMKKVYSCIKSRISECERGKILQTNTYKEAGEQDGDAVKQLKEKLNIYLDEIDIEDEEIREAYIEKKVCELDGYKYRNEVMKMFEKTVLTQNYAMLSLMFDDNDEYQKIMLLSEVDEEELKESFENIEYEYQEEINSLLENN